MKKIYEKNELTFALISIGIYVVSQSIANSFHLLGIEYSANAVVSIVLTVLLFFFINKNGLPEKYGLCKTSIPAGKFLWYIPLFLLASHNLWNGFAINLPLAASICYILYMIGVGFIEEVIFRGFLFRALEKDNVKTAIIISSVTFGLGHLVNLINSNGMDFITNLCQVVGAIAIGFLFMILFYRSGSLLPCILTHVAIDVASCFANEADMTPERRILFSISRAVIVIVYTLILLKTLPKRQK